jgi:ABC-type phosphate transport system substrate-binding protein
MLQGASSYPRKVSNIMVKGRRLLLALWLASLSILAVNSVAAAANTPFGGVSDPAQQMQTEAELAAGTLINGTGSSFAAPAIETWVNHVQSAPYSLQIRYVSSSSGQGRFEFTGQTTDYAVSDIGYLGATDNQPPSFAFNFIPITAGGIAFMYDVPGLTKPLQLSARSACALLTGGIKNWNDPNLAADNPGVTLPNLPVVPVTESDSAGTNYVLEEWCIAEQPALWAAFVSAQESQSGGPTDGVVVSPTAPNSNWPGIKGGLDDTTTTAVAGDIATNPGSIGAVQVKYADDEPGFGGSDPTKNVALVQNASGDYTAPTPVDVASALAYASQLPNGTHQLNFGGLGAHVYNPSTYSYLLTPTTGWPATKGQTMSNFVNYVLTLGQEIAPSFGYASLGLSLEQYGIDTVTKNVPGSVAPTAAEKAAYSCGDLTPAEVAAGKTTPTCGVVNQTAAPPPPNGGTTTGAPVTGTTTAKSSTSTTNASTPGTKNSNASSVAAVGSNQSGSGASGSGGTNVGNGSSGADPTVSLAGASALPNTGGNPIPLTALGGSLVVIGWVGRRIRRGRTGMAK